MVQLARRSPTILNVAWGTSFFWDGRAHTLEAQALGPIVNEVEMNMPLEELPGKLSAIPGYQSLFDAAYPNEPVSPAVIARALATFERGVVSGRSAFDRWVEGDETALTASERRGFDVFVGPGHCADCHSGWNFTDGRYHDTGLPSADLGRAAVEPDSPLARYAFKTPSLRDIVRRAPYMHDGSLPTLNAVVRFYEASGVARTSLSPQLQPTVLHDRQRDDLVAFLSTLTAPSREFAAPALPR